VSQYAIFESNNLKRRSRIYAGKTLIVPVPLDRDYAKSKQKKNREFIAEGSVYTVKSGDTMWDIARAFGSTVNALRRVNYINRGSRIYVGQKLKIPIDAKNLRKLTRSTSKAYASKGKSSSKASGKTASIGQTSASNVKTHTVRAGDTLWDIARMFGTTTANIRRLNGLGRSSRIYPGQELKVRGSGGAQYVTHKVRRGESLSRIAKKYRTSIARILANNHLEDPNSLRVGQELRIKTR
jgi:LysM repeat protein